MTDKVGENDVAGATHSSTVETQQPPAPTREDGTLGTTDDGELNPPTGATSSTTISPDQFKQLLSTVTELVSEEMKEEAMGRMESLLSTVNNDGSTIMTPPPSQANSGARGLPIYTALLYIPAPSNLPYGSRHVRPEYDEQQQPGMYP